MNNTLTRALFVTLGLLVTTAAHAASTQADFDAAYADAQSAEKEAGAMKNRWTTTEQAVADAKKAAAAAEAQTVEIELANVEKANLIAEI